MSENEKKSFFARLRGGLEKTRQAFAGSIDTVLKAFVKIDEDLFEELLDVLISADIGASVSMDIIDVLRDKVKSERLTDPADVKGTLKEILAEQLSGDNSSLCLNTHPSVILVIGVNGVGKTTTIGKMAASLKAQGKSVILAAADTFRAAAINQLQLWGERVGVPVIHGEEGADPASVIYDACSAAKSRGADVLICDTAGRLHNKKNLMEELNKMYRIIGRELPECEVESLLVLDATTGQNAVNQAESFSEVTNLTGIVLTKLDGSAKGGIVIAIRKKLGIPIKFIGVGEGVDDLQPFDAQNFSKALLMED